MEQSKILIIPESLLLTLWNHLGYDIIFSYQENLVF